MAAYRRVYDSRHLQADGISSGTLHSVIVYGLPFLSTRRPTFHFNVDEDFLLQKVLN